MLSPLAGADRGVGVGESGNVGSVSVNTSVRGDRVEGVVSRERWVGGERVRAPVTRERTDGRQHGPRVRELLSRPRPRPSRRAALRPGPGQTHFVSLCPFSAPGDS